MKERLGWLSVVLFHRDGQDPNWALCSHHASSLNNKQICVY